MTLDVSEIEELGKQIIFPVRVYLKETEEFIFIHNVCLRSEFFHELKATKDWEAQLRKIIKSRLREEIVKRSNGSQMAIEDKLKMFSETSESL